MSTPPDANRPSSSPAGGTPPGGTAKARPSAAGRYLFLFLLGLVLGAVGVVMGLRAIDARKTWQDHYPHAAMRLMQAHASQLAASADANRCSPTDLLPHLQSLRSLGNDLEPAFGELGTDKRFIAHAGQFRATLDSALASPPLNCNSLKDVQAKVGETCKACHQDFAN
jgi:cytochrome c556